MSDDLKILSNILSYDKTLNVLIRQFGWGRSVIGHGSQYIHKVIKWK